MPKTRLLSDTERALISQALLEKSVDDMKRSTNWEGPGHDRMRIQFALQSAQGRKLADLIDAAQDVQLVLEPATESANEAYTESLEHAWNSASEAV